MAFRPVSFVDIAAASITKVPNYFGGIGKNVADVPGGQTNTFPVVSLVTFAVLLVRSVMSHGE